MSKSAIEWTDETWNPVTGCTKISPGCALCYAKTLHDMRHKAHAAGKRVPQTYATPFETVVLHPERLNALPIGGAPRRVFVNSMSDLFHDDVPDEFLDQVFAAMALRPHMTFQVLTKRAQRMAEYLSRSGRHNEIELAGERLARGPETFGGKHVFRALPLPNVWLGVSVENQEYADERIPWLMKTPAARRFLSIEPMLGPVDLNYLNDGKNGWLDCLGGVWGHGFSSDARGNGTEQIPDGTTNDAIIDWVIVGGESGAAAKPMQLDWARSIRDQCQAAGVPFFFKQWGTWFPTHEFGKTIAPWRKSDGRLLDGREWNEFPETTRLG